MEPLTVIALSFLTALFLTVTFTPLTIRLAKKYHLVDDPESPHPAHIHQGIIPKAGGIPIFIALVTSILLFVPFDKHILGIILGVAVLLAVGILDDIVINLSPYPRLITQVLAASLVVISGVGITFVTNPFGGILRLDTIIIPIDILGSHNIILIADIFAFLWIVWMMNIVNWSWGVDGQMPGIISIAALVIGAISLQQFFLGDTNQLGLATLAAITSATALGFLIFNWHPAKIFPGDSGSNILGFMIATLCILSSAKLAVALLVMLIPTIDFVYTFFRRVLNKKSPFFGDQKHLHHLLLKRGWSHQKISLFYLISCAILGLLAVSLSSQGKIFTFLTVTIIVLGALTWLHLFTRKVIEGEK